ncbi:MAG: ferredoxin, partial [Methanobrevibacter sp.]|nr:ferredoxin [Methanobrevibacter sp.]
MRRIHFADISIFLVNRIFNWRFWIAGLTKKSKIAKKVINKMLFEKDEIVVIPNTINVNKKIEAEKSEFLP